MFPHAKMVGSFAVAIGLATGIALAQTAPTARPAGPSAAMPLRLAYRAIGAAESRGAAGRYLDAARTHYRSALARFGRNDSAGAAREAGASAALAKAAIDERPIPVPRDLPAPPPMPAAAPRVAMGGPPGMRGPARRSGGHGFGMMRNRFDPEALARYTKVENTPEATDLAKTAMDADAARARSLFAGNREDALRQGTIARDLSMAIRMLAYADHPEAFPRPVMRRPMGGGPPNGRGGFRAPAGSSTTGTVGLVTPETGAEAPQP